MKYDREFDPREWIYNGKPPLVRRTHKGFLAKLKLFFCNCEKQQDSPVVKHFYYPDISFFQCENCTEWKNNRSDLQRRKDFWEMHRRSWGIRKNE